MPGGLLVVNEEGNMTHWDQVDSSGLHVSKWSDGFHLRLWVTCRCGRMLTHTSYDGLTASELQDVLAETQLVLPGAALWHDGHGDTLVADALFD